MKLSKIANVIIDCLKDGFDPDVKEVWFQNNKITGYVYKSSKDKSKDAKLKML